MADLAKLLNLDALTCSRDALRQQGALATTPDACLPGTALGSRSAVVQQLAVNTEALVRSVESIRPSARAEVRVQTDLGEPLANERCILQVGPDLFQETRTDADGVARFLYFVLEGSEGFIPRLFLPDVLEAESADPAWVPDQPTKDRRPEAGLRRRDATWHLVVPGVARLPVTINRLSEEEKFQHILRAYTDNRATFANGNPGDYAADKQEHWDRFRGAKCNQHINYFLGYWFNYNHKFVRAGSTTSVCALPMYSSAVQAFSPYPHRGYGDFVEPLPDAYGTRNIKGVPEDSLKRSPPGLTWGYAYEEARYLRLSEYFGADGTPTAAGRALIADLADFNLYSVSDYYYEDAAKTKQARDTALAEARKWLQASLVPDPTYPCKSFTHHGVLFLEKALDKEAAKTAPKHKVVPHLTDNDVWDAIWHLDPGQPAERAVIRTLCKRLNTDHHGGILLKRGPNRTSPRGVAPDDIELWTFSADGTNNAPKPIILRELRETMQGAYRTFAHWAIWKLRDLRPGGYAPLVASPPKDGVGVNNPPRFIHWHA